ncbi:MAG: copper amine oxidase N-terminal domain-containing protein [Moorellales bacterium]
MNRRSRFLSLILVGILVVSLLVPAVAAASPQAGLKIGHQQRTELRDDGATVKASAAPQNQERLRERQEERTQAEIAAGTQENGTRIRANLRVRERVQVRLFTGKVFLNGREFRFDPDDQPPVIKEGRVLIPVRALSRGLKAEVRWDPETKTVTVTRNDTTIVLVVDKLEVWVNGEKQELDVPALLLNNRVLVPLRFINQALRCRVQYDQDTGNITVEEPAEEANEQEQSTVEEEQAGANEETGAAAAEETAGSASESGNQSTAPTESSGSESGAGSQ